MKKASNIVVKILAIVLLTAAVLKGWQLLTEPVANNDIWSYRPFLILTVEFELALAIWLLSGLFKKAAWLTSLLCFSAFSVITLYRGITGAESCGCFGSVHVNPWITLFAIDLPAVIALSVFRPRRHPERNAVESKDLWTSLQSFLKPLPSIQRFAITVCLGLAVLGVTAPILAFNEPAMVTSSYEVLEPETWVGKKLPILEHIDIAETLKKGTWLVLFYHYDCPDCVTAIREYQRKVTGHESRATSHELKIAFIEVPPYGRSVVRNNPNYAVGKLSDIKEWFITTPAVVLVDNSMVRNSWEEKAPDLDDAVLRNIAMLSKSLTSNIGF